MGINTNKLNSSGVKLNQLNAVSSFARLAPSLKLFADKDLASESLVNFTRASVKQYFASDGLLKEAAVDSLPVSFDPADGSRLGWLIEESRTNEALHSQDLTQSEWSKTNGTAVKDQAGLDGNSNSASSFEATSANATVLQTVSDGTSQQRTYSVYIKRLTGSGNIEITIDGGSTWTDKSGSIDSSDFTRVEVTNTGTNPQFGIRLPTSGDKIAVDISQLEDGSFTTSPIITGGSAVTRSADVADITDLSWYNQDEGTIIVELYETQDDGLSYILQLGPATDRIAVLRNSGDLQCVIEESNTITFNERITTSINQTNKIAASFSSNGASFCVNGGTVVSDSSVVMPTVSKLTIGARQVSTDFVNNFIKSLKYYPFTLSDAKLQQLTS